MFDDFVREEGDYRDGLSEGDRLKEIATIWCEIHINGYSGATDWTVLEEMEREVTEAMRMSPPDVDRAEYLTFKALHAIVGNIDS